MVIAGRGFYFPAMVTVWHVEPDGADALTVCRETVRDVDGKFIRFTSSWKWHVHHWKVQVGPLQALRRRLLTRCEWCGGRGAKSNPVNVSRGWHSPKRRWWQGEADLFHGRCLVMANSRHGCACDSPVSPGGEWGDCARCGERRYGYSDSKRAALRMLREYADGAVPGDAEWASYLERAS